MDLGLDGRTCVVTGASRGIGRATAERLAAEGAQVVLVGRDAAALQDAAATCAGRGHVLACDITAPGAADEVAAAAAALGEPWALVNNAGTTYARGIDELTDADWHALYDLHVVAPMRLMQRLVPGMARAGGGRVVNVCSSAGKRPSATNPAYSVTKAAQLSLSRLFADLHAAEDVLVNAVTPGPVASELWMAEGGMADQTAAARGVSREEALAIQSKKVPLGRFAEPGEVADVVVFLCSERASTVTGAAWSADGGAVAIIV